MKYAIAVFDIGKTNKKIVLFDDQLNVLDIGKRHIDTFKQDNLDVEDVDQIEEWMLQELKNAASQYPVQTISISTHGASAVCVGQNGKPSVPPIAYTNDVPDSIHEGFYGRFGSIEELQQKTATAEVKPLINVGKLLYYLSVRFPQDFEKTKHVLFFPQYFGYRLTGTAGADLTYAGCHTYLWDPKASDWSPVADGLGIRDALPTSVGKPTDVLGTITPEVAEKTGLSPDTTVTLGIHDSNSSLIPYLISQDQDFVLNSTGSWCVAMHAVDAISFRPEELGKMVFFNLSYRGTPVKTSILTGGLEFDTYRAILADLHNREDDPGFDDSIYKDLVSAADTFVLPSVIRGAGQFPDSRAKVVEKEQAYPLEDIQSGREIPPAFLSYEKGYAAVNLSVAVQTKVALQRVGLTPGTEVFIEGGFRNNDAYLAMLADLLPENPVTVTAFEEATSVGAALCAKAAHEKVSLESLRSMVDIEKKRVDPAGAAEADSYSKAFLKRVESV